MAITIAPPLRGERRDQRLEQLGAGPVEAGEGLVEQQHPGVLDQGPGDQHPLALAAGELAEGLAREGLEADPLQRRPRRRAILAPGRRHQGRRESAPIVATSRAETG